MFRFFGLFFIFGILLLSACGERTIIGSGNVVEETRQVADFEQITVCCGMELVLTQGEGPFLHIEAEDNLLSEITSEVSQGTLHIEFKDLNNLAKYRPTKPIRVMVTAETIRGASVSGGGRLEAETITSDDLEISLSGGSEGSINEIIADTLQADVLGGGNMSLGSGTIGKMILNLSGDSDTQITAITAEELIANVSGGGQIIAQNLLAKQLQLELTGGSRARVTEFKGESLEIVINGGGAATLAGDVTDQTIQLNGGSSYLGPDLLSRSAVVQGNGDAVIWATGSLDVELSGNARVEYFGHPLVSQRLSGNSEVVPLGGR